MTGMVGDAGHTMRNAGLLMAQRGFHLLGVTLFAVLVPRLMGPTLFGRYALLISVSMWFALLSAPGAVSMLARSIPRFVATNDGDGLRRLATSLVVLRAVTGSFSAMGYFLIVTLVLGEPDPLAAAFVAGGVLSCTVGNLSFALFLGLNQAARWGLGELLRRWMTLALVPIGFAAAGLRGACLGFLGAEMTVLVCGLWWARRYLRWADVDLSRRHLRPHLRTGMHFAAGAVLMVFTQRSGEALVRFSTGRYEEVAFFGLAYAIYLTIAQALWQFAIAFAPFLVTLLEHGRRDDIARWLERLLKYMVVCAVLALAGMIFVGHDLVPLLLGAKYHAVAANAVPAMLALLTLSVGMTGRLLALTLDRPGAAAAAAAIELAAFWSFGVPLALRAGSLGACWAVVPASALYASYITWRMRRELPFSLGDAGRAVALSLVFAPLAFLRGAWPANALLLTAGAMAYGVLLLRSRVITTAEIVELWGLLRSARSADAPVS
jgi:O-antigen/teichoic acid export membrane protein